MTYALRNSLTGNTYTVGDEIELREQGETEIVKITFLEPPHREGTSGRVYARCEDGLAITRYAFVFGCEFVDEEDK